MILGAAVRLEERVAAGEADPRAIGTFKVGLMGSLGAIGDSYFWGALKPMASAVGGILALVNPVLGIVALLLLYNASHLAIRFRGFASGMGGEESAVRYLKEAGFANGFDVTFYVPESGSGMQSPVEMGTVIQANLAAVGVRAKIQTMEWGAYLKKYLDGPDMAEMSWNPSIGDPDHMMYMLLSSDRFPPAFNAGFYQNPRVDELLRKGRTTIDDKERIPLYREAQRLVMEDAPWIFVDHGKQVIVHRKRVQGFKLHPNFDLVLTQVWLQ